MREGEGGRAEKGEEGPERGRKGRGEGRREREGERGRKRGKKGGR